MCITPISTASPHRHHPDISGDSHGNEREGLDVASGLTFQLATLDRQVGGHDGRFSNHFGCS